MADDIDKLIHDPMLFPVRDREPFTTESPFLSLEDVLERTNIKLSRGKRGMMFQEVGDVEDDTDFTIGADQEEGKVDLYPGVAGVSDRVIEMFWQVQHRFKQKKTVENPKSRGIEAKQYVIGSMLHTGLIPMISVLGEQPLIAARRVSALDEGDENYLGKFSGAKRIELTGDFKSRHATSYRIGYLNGLDKHMLYDLRDSYNWHLGDTVNIVLIYGIACSTSLLPWDTVVLKAREQIIGFLEWFKQSYE